MEKNILRKLSPTDWCSQWGYERKAALYTRFKIRRSRRGMAGTGYHKPLVTISFLISCRQELPRWLAGKESAYGCRRCEFDPQAREIPGGGHGNPSSIVAWKIPWTEKPEGLQSMDHRVGHDWVSLYAYKWIMENSLQRLALSLPRWKLSCQS